MAYGSVIAPDSVIGQALIQSPAQCLLLISKQRFRWMQYTTSNWRT